MTPPRTCDQLGVCQDRKPACSGCPSEGDKSARSIWEVLKDRPLIHVPRYVRKGVN